MREAIFCKDVYISNNQLHSVQQAALQLSTMQTIRVVATQLTNQAPKLHSERTGCNCFSVSIQQGMNLEADSPTRDLRNRV